MPKFGKTSTLRLQTCDQRLQAILNEAIKHMDFAVLCGHRPKPEQDRLYRLSRSKLQYPNSKHNQSPSMAVDIAPWYPDSPHIRWDDYKGFIYLAGLVKGIAISMDLTIRWGGDFNSNNDLQDNRFNDFPHFELAMFD